MAREQHNRICLLDKTPGVVDPGASAGTAPVATRRGTARRPRRRQRLLRLEVHACTPLAVYRVRLREIDFGKEAEWEMRTSLYRHAELTKPMARASPQIRPSENVSTVSIADLAATGRCLHSWTVSLANK